MLATLITVYYNTPNLIRAHLNCIRSFYRPESLRVIVVLNSEDEGAEHVKSRSDVEWVQGIANPAVGCFEPGLAFDQAMWECNVNTEAVIAVHSDTWFLRRGVVEFLYGCLQGHDAAGPLYYGAYIHMHCSIYRTKALEGISFAIRERDPKSEDQFADVAALASHFIRKMMSDAEIPPYIYREWGGNEIALRERMESDLRPWVSALNSFNFIRTCFDSGEYGHYQLLRAGKKINHIDSKALRVFIRHKWGGSHGSRRDLIPEEFQRYA